MRAPPPHLQPLIPISSAVFPTSLSAAGDTAVPDCSSDSDEHFLSDEHSFDNQGAVLDEELERWYDFEGMAAMTHPAPTEIDIQR